MRAHIIFNPTSGIFRQRRALDDLQEALADAGYIPIHHATEEEKDLDKALDGVDGLVVAAGGDGTVRATVRRLLGRRVPLTIVPMGTANNIARTLGIGALVTGDLARLSTPEKRAFDVGLLHAPWGEDFFLEGAGFGFFADLLSAYDPGQGKSILRGITTLVDTARHLESYSTRMVLDGGEIVGDFVMVEVLNTRAIGPRLAMAPEADPSDGLLDFAIVYQRDQDSLLRYMVAGMTNGLGELRNVEYRRGRRLQIAWSGFPVHVDDKVQPAVGWSSPAQGKITLEVLPQALELWLPPPPNNA